MESQHPHAVALARAGSSESPPSVRVPAGRVPDLTPNGLTVLERRYLLRDEAGRPIEKPAELFRRVAHAVAAPDARYGDDPRAAEERFFERMARLELLPNSPTLMNAGRDLGQLAACFVVPVGDSMPEIFDAVKWAAVIQMTGGGTGFAFSRLRPAGDTVSSTRGVASGPLPFMDIFNSATDAIKQGGTRRGANMGVLRVDHPDILEFITAKLDPARLTNFNVSVAITDEFMAAVAENRTYALVNPRTRAEVKRLHAARIFELLVNSAWSIGDPGVIFIDRINATQPTPGIGDIESTNPCVTGDTRVWVENGGLVPIRDLVGTTPRIATMADGRVVFRDATRVVRTGVRPVVRLVTSDGHELRLTRDHLVTTDHGDVPAGELKRGERVCLMRAVDTDVSFAAVAETIPLREEEVFDLTEPTTQHFFANGLLVHNCGEQPLLPFESCVLASINLSKFVDEDGIAWERLRGAIRDGVHFLDNVIDANRYPLAQIDATTKANRKIGLGVMGFADLLIALGIPYDSERALEVAEEIGEVLETESIAASAALAEKRGPFPNYLRSRWLEEGGPALRNATTTTVAPTGTISIIAGCSSGIEPLYAVSYQRNVLEGERLVEVHPEFQRLAEERGFATEAVMARIAERGSVRGLDEVPADVQAIFATAHDVAPEIHVRMQAAFQQHVHAAVSKTVNLAHDAPPEAVAEVYRLAYDLGCKGVTVYRDGSRGEQVLSFGDMGERVASLRPVEDCPECGSRLVGHGGCVACRSCGWSRCG